MPPPSPLPFDPLKPSLFELLSSHQLSTLLAPTARYLLTIATHRHPRYLLRILNSFDELFALCMLVIERHYLRTYSASFTEYFYGLKRERAVAALVPLATSGSPGLARDALGFASTTAGRGVGSRSTSRRDVWMNLAVMVGVPYVKRKLDEAYEIEAPRALLGSAYNVLPAGATRRQRLGWWARMVLRRVYPGVNAVYHLAMMACCLRYLFDQSGMAVHDPFLWLVGVRIRRMGMDDYRAVEEAAMRNLAAAKGGGGGIKGLMGKALGSLTVALPTGIFVLKFLEWWYASDFARQLTRKATEGIELPPPIISGMLDADSEKQQEQKTADTSMTAVDDHKSAPTAEELAKNRAPIAKGSSLPIFTVATPDDSALCPICENEIVTPTACQTGVVFCYVCIFKWVDGQHARQEAFMADRKGQWESGVGRCAVTGRRVLAGTDGLRRIMI